MPAPHTHKRASFEETLDFANRVRAAGGGNPLDALVPAVPVDTEKCLIAKNLNFNCVVRCSRTAFGDDVWVMRTDPEIAERIAEELGLEVGTSPNLPYKDVRLPVGIGQVAWDFDRAFELLYDVGYRARLRVEEGIEGIEDAIRSELELLSEAQRKLIADMEPYIDASTDEVHKIASLVNDDGSIVI